MQIDLGNQSLMGMLPYLVALPSQSMNHWLKALKVSESPESFV